jgi:recombination protein RecA
MSQALRKLAGNLNRSNTLCLFTNQIREKIGVMFGSPETQPGGRALKFYSSQRLDIRRIETLKEGTEAVGNRVRVKVVKNKVAPPFRQAEFDIEYGVGISKEGGLLDLAIEHDLVQKSGSFFSYGETRLGQGRNNTKEYLRQNPETFIEIQGKLYEKLGFDSAGNISAAPVAVEEAPEAEAEAKPEPEAKPDDQPETKPDDQPETKPEAAEKAKPAQAKPQKKAA